MNASEEILPRDARLLLGRGEVWLAGAGPGDPGLLTLHALSGLRQADVVMHDALVGEGVLALAREDAEILHTGKRGGRGGCSQSEIVERMISHARAGRRVLRLKGGDPCMFGRGGEEAAALAEAGVSFRVIPGVTAALGALEYAGVPPTHRDVNHAVSFITGHVADEDCPKLDWGGIARGSPVLVFYMAVGRVRAIQERLLAEGRGSDEVAVVVENGTLADQRVLRTVLGSLADDVERERIVPPAVVVIGQGAYWRSR